MTKVKKTIRKVAKKSPKLPTETIVIRYTKEHKETHAELNDAISKLVWIARSLVRILDSFELGIENQDSAVRATFAIVQKRHDACALASHRIHPKGMLKKAAIAAGAIFRDSSRTVEK